MSDESSATVIHWVPHQITSVQRGHMRNQNFNPTCWHTVIAFVDLIFIRIKFFFRDILLIFFTNNVDSVASDVTFISKYAFESWPGYWLRNVHYIFVLTSPTGIVGYVVWLFPSYLQFSINMHVESDRNIVAPVCVGCLFRARRTHVIARADGESKYAAYRVNLLSNNIRFEFLL